VTLPPLPVRRRGWGDRIDDKPIQEKQKVVRTQGEKMDKKQHCNATTIITTTTTPPSSSSRLNPYPDGCKVTVRSMPKYLAFAPPFPWFGLMMQRILPIALDSCRDLTFFAHLLLGGNMQKLSK